MTQKEFRKIDDAARRIVAKKYGWRQSGYLNWIVEKDYYFSLLHLQPKDAIFEVKPLYFDDLWWEISGMFKNEKKPPMSLRGWGCAAISSQEIARYDVIVNNPDSYTADVLEKVWNEVFEKLSSDVHQFLKDYPDANTFFPDESRVRAFDRDRLDYIMALLHNDRYEEVISIITDAKSKNHECSFRGSKGDSYDYILEWCEKTLYKDEQTGETHHDYPELQDDTSFALVKRVKDYYLKKIAPMLLLCNVEE